MYNILASGSKGNAVIIEDRILIDCGVPFKALKPFVNDLALVLLTHIHSDHFNARTISKLAEERPGLRWGCPPWLARDLKECGIKPYNLMIYFFGKVYTYAFPALGYVTVNPFRLYHDVNNCGYKLDVGGKKILYATDTCKIETEAKGFDYYLIEGNYTEDELKERIERKQAEGAEHIYDLKVPEKHLSREAATEWLMANAGPNSVIEFMHVHKDEPPRDTLPDAQEGEYTPDPGTTPHTGVATASQGDITGVISHNDEG